MKVLVTGAAGFIGYHVARAAVEAAHEVVGLDNLSDYYDPKLKQDRLAQLSDKPNFQFIKVDLSDRDRMADLFRNEAFDRVIHLAAQAGVRHSVTHPYAYLDSNLAGFLNVLEGCRHTKVGHLVFASSSSVYGLNQEQPFSAHQNVDHPLSLYAATKKANELMAHSYSHLYGLPMTGLRFFTAYGPWGRPDMATFLFTKKILAGQKIQVFNYGQMKRDFVYVEELAQGVLDTMEVLPKPDPLFDPMKPDPTTSSAPYRIYNIGNHTPVDLLRLIQVIEKCLGKKADLELMPLQAGDLVDTCADISELSKATGFEPRVGIEEGIARFVEWYRGYYRV